jgi:molybdenum cofactor cytidylyltransferase
MIFAVIPAAGKSSRMGCAKLALPLGDGTVLGTVIHALRLGRVDHILVVIGPHVPELVPLARAAQIEICELAHETSDMRATVEAGLGWLEARHQPKPGDCWLLAPGDHPALEPGVVRRLIEASSANSPFSIWIPTYQCKRGHPTLVRWTHVLGIRKLATDQGLNAYFREHAHETLEVPVESAAILENLDTPEDYERLRKMRRP